MQRRPNSYFFSSLPNPHSLTRYGTAGSTIARALSLPQLPLDKTELKSFISAWKRANATANANPNANRLSGDDAGTHGLLLADANLVYEAMMELFLREAAWTTPLLFVSSDVTPPFTVKFDAGVTLKSVVDAAAFVTGL